MADLVYKDIKLSLHETTYIFFLLAAMLLIPSYPYYVAFMYTELSIFFIFLTGRENNDVFFSLLLPVRKRDIVKARILVVSGIEMIQILLSIPFAIIGQRINPNGSNQAGIESNFAFYGFVLIMFALFNLQFFTSFYKTGYKVGRALLFSGITTGLYIGVAEVIVQVVPALKATLDTTDPAMAKYQLPVLAAGVVIFVLFDILAYRRSAKEFEKVDI